MIKCQNEVFLLISNMIMASITNPNLYRFKTFQGLSQAAGQPIIEAIETGQLDGVIIEGVFSSEEAATLSSRFLEMATSSAYASIYHSSPFGHVFGPTLMEDNLEMYFQRAILARRGFEYVFRRRFEAHMVGILSSLTHAYSIFPAVSGDDNLISLASARVCEPGHDALEAHVHREFPLYFPSYLPLSRMLDLATELSIYFMLQAPDQGGELVLYDLQWDNTPKEFLQARAFLTGLRSDELAAYDQMHIALAPGDVILFAANRIWHKVAAVTGGEKARITIGGFTARAHDRAEYGYFM